MTESNRDDVFLLDLLRRVIKDEGLPAEVKINIKADSQSGNGFVGINSLIEIQSKSKALKLFSKVASKSEILRRQIFVDALFGREIYFYETVYPTVLKFQMDRNVRHPFDNVCRCYLTSAENLHETLIFENLKEQGYVQYNKKIEMNEQTITFVFKLYARFHAVSYAMKDQEPHLYAELSENLQDIIWDVFKSVGIDLIIKHHCEKAKQLFDPVRDAYVSNRIKNLTETLMDHFSRLDEVVDYSVIAHGDCWFNNFLFKYKDPNNQNTLEDIKVLDWQVMRVGSPVLDLSYFFYGIATKTTLNQLDSFLKTYHDTLSENIREMGSDPEKLYPYEVFRGHWKQFSKFGLMMAFSVQEMLLMEKLEILAPAEIVDAGVNWGESFISRSSKNEAYEQRIREIIEHFVYNDFI